MAGRYLKAPLSYVVARINTSPLPKLVNEQGAYLGQEMALNGLIFREHSDAKQFDFTRLVIDVPDDPFKIELVNRTCFLDKSKTNSFLIEQNGLEFRTTSYTTYYNFIESFEKLLQTLIECVPAIGKAQIGEVVLSYVDVIVPSEGYELKDFFSKKDLALPMNAYGHQDGVYKSAKNEFNSVIDEKHRVSISLEQIPQSVGRLIPDSMIEPEGKFGMPINLHYPPSKQKEDDYIILSTFSAQIHDASLEEKNLQEIFKDAHSYSREAFDSLIDPEVCNKVWEYKE
ncbi:TIGR04255 family protein [Rahnella aceris]|uniref:TIGR04255 family protein n=1 Tax=Rahnella sp. (strain Y9602) TaxID=2703885 RepID=A0ABW6CDP9_RAHSY